MQSTEPADSPVFDELFEELRRPYRPATGAPVALAFEPVGASVSDRNTALVGVVNQVNAAAQHSARGQLLLHCGALGSELGDCLVLSGASGSGKSTLTASLLDDSGGDQGALFAYLTDECVSLRPEDLRITPYPKPLQLKRPSHALLSQLAPEPGSPSESMMWFQRLVPPKRLGGIPIPSVPLFPRLVVLPQWMDDAPVAVERLSPGAAVASLSENSAFFRDVDGGGLTALARLTRHAPAYRVVYGRHDEATEAILELWSTAA